MFKLTNSSVTATLRGGRSEPDASNSGQTWAANGKAAPPSARRRTAHPACDEAEAASSKFREISFAEISHQFETTDGPLPTLGQLSLTVREKEFVTVVGPSGCGKSTLFNLAAGLLAPSAGEIRVNGARLMGVNPHVAYMFQQPALLDWRTVLDNVTIGQEFLGISRKQARREAREELGRFGLARHEKSHPWELSGGLRQRVALLRTYMTHRDLLLLDEPFGALDALTRLQMQQFLLDKWQEDRRTVVFITHDVDEALLLGSRVIVLSQRPARVLEEFEVAFPRPREAEMVLSNAEFIRLKRHLLGLLREGRR